MGRPDVTIGISTYNRADSYLPQALDSALAQTHPNIEVVVSDNASSDRTEALVRERACDRLRYHRQARNIGANGNFNYVLEQARGRYFLLLHDDDRIDPDFVESCVAALEGAGEVGVVRTGTRVIDAESRVLSESPNDCAGLAPAELFLAWFDRSTAFYLCSTLYHTERLRAAGGFRSKTNLFQDVVALARLAVPYGRVDVRDVKASFRRHGANKGSSDGALDWATDSLYLLELLTELMPEHAAELRRAGLPYLCRKCYRGAGNIPNAAERWRTYLTIYGLFERSYSPLSYVLEKTRKEARRAVAKMVKGERSPERLPAP